jgi:hypothetical protein
MTLVLSKKPLVPIRRDGQIIAQPVINTVNKMGGVSTSTVVGMSWPAGAGVPIVVTGSSWGSTLSNTTVGSNFITLTNPGAISFIKINADNSITTNTAINQRTALGLAIGTDVLAQRSFGTAANNNTGDFLAQRSFGTAANNNTGDFLAQRSFGTAANNNTGDFLAYNAQAVDSNKLNGQLASYYAPLASPTFTGTGSWDSSTLYVDATNHRIGIGTTAPLNTLDVKVATNQHIGIRQANGYASLGTFNDVGLAYVRMDVDASVLNLNSASGGNVGIGTTSPNKLLTLADSGNIGSLTFTSGWGQPGGWKITNTSSLYELEVDSLRVRGGMSVREIIVNQLRYQDGGLLIGSGGGKIKSVYSSSLGSEQLYFEAPNGTAMSPFASGSIVMLQIFDINRTTIIKKIVRQVSAVQGGDMRVDLTTTAGWTTGNDTGTFAAGDYVVAIGHTGTAALQNNIYMSATDGNNPFLRMQAGVDSYAKWSIGTKTSIKLQLGNLADLASYDIISASPGYGLYCNNVFLSGTIVASAGTIGGWTLNTDAIYSGTKFTGNFWSASGVTLANNGAFHSPNFYINSNGDVGLRKIMYGYNLSNTPLIQNNGIVTTTNTFYTKLHTITLGSYITTNLTLKIYFEFKTNAATHNVWAKVYKNGSPIGNEQVDYTGSYVGYSQDIAGWNAGDTIELWGYASSGYICYVQNFQVRGTHNLAVNELDGTSTS